MKVKCILCGKEITSTDKYVLFGIEGDFAHVQCNNNKEKYYDKIDNMTDKEFVKYMTKDIKNKKYIWKFSKAPWQIYFYDV